MLWLPDVNQCVSAGLISINQLNSKIVGMGVSARAYWEVAAILIRSRVWSLFNYLMQRQSSQARVYIGGYSVQCAKDKPAHPAGNQTSNSFIWCHTLLHPKPHSREPYHRLLGKAANVMRFESGQTAV